MRISYDIPLKKLVQWICSGAVCLEHIFVFVRINCGGDNMFRIGDRIVYGSTGVCTVEDITTVNLRGVDKSRTLSDSRKSLESRMKGISKGQRKCFLESWRLRWRFPGKTSRTILRSD